MTAKERPIVKCAKIVAFYGSVSDSEKDKIKSYLINPVEAREASAEKPATLVDKYDIPTTVANVDGFLDMSDEDLEALRKSMGLAMSFADIKFVQDFFKEQGRVPTVTEIRVLDTYWSDHCRHTTFLTNLTDIKFEGDDELTAEIKETYKDYLATREDVYGERITSKPVCLMDIGTIAGKKLKEQSVTPFIPSCSATNSLSKGYVVPASAPEPKGEILARSFASLSLSISRLNISIYAER